MLDETLVVWVGEFGRSPYINAKAGRDHWGHVFSAPSPVAESREVQFSGNRITRRLSIGGTCRTARFNGHGFPLPRLHSGNADS
jgi:hypothetical protein